CTVSCTSEIYPVSLHDALPIFPPSWRTMLLLGAAPLVFGLVAYGRRFGPPYDTERRLPPDRQAYLDAVAGILQRSGSRRTAAQILREEIGRASCRERV